MITRPLSLMVDLLGDLAPILTWALAVAAVGLAVAGLMVRVQTPERSQGAAVAWTAVILLVPILGPVVYLSRGVVLDRRAQRRRGEPGRPEKSPAELYPPEELERRRRRTEDDGGPDAR